MKIIIQIPCLNEESTLEQTVLDIPREIPGADDVEILVVDDGSVDATAMVARDVGVDHIVRHTANRGLAAAFQTGLEASLRLGADVIVNTDGDNQYRGPDIRRLVGPILAGEADVVVGDRRTWTLSHFPIGKRILQVIGSWVVRRLSGTQVPDAVSGFRAFSREAARRLNVLTTFSYTIETLIQAGESGLKVASVPVRTNPKTRESRLFRSVPQFLIMSLWTMVRVYAMYHPLRTFTLLGAAPLFVGIAAILRFIYLWYCGEGDGHVQSLVIGCTALLTGFLTIMIGLMAQLMAANRRLVEMTLDRLRELDINREEEHETVSTHF